MKSNAKLKGKDLINIGIYAYHLLCHHDSRCYAWIIPIMMPMLCALVPLVGGIPMMLFMTKVDKFGMITIYFHDCRIIFVDHRDGLLAVYLWNRIWTDCGSDRKEWKL